MIILDTLTTVCHVIHDSFPHVGLKRASILNEGKPGVRSIKNIFGLCPNGFSMVFQWQSYDNWAQFNNMDEDVLITIQLIPNLGQQDAKSLYFWHDQNLLMTWVGVWQSFYPSFWDGVSRCRPFMVFRRCFLCFGNYFIKLLFWTTFDKEIQIYQICIHRCWNGIWIVFPKLLWQLNCLESLFVNFKSYATGVFFKKNHFIASKKFIMKGGKEQNCSFSLNNETNFLNVYSFNFRSRQSQWDFFCFSSGEITLSENPQKPSFLAFVNSGFFDFFYPLNFVHPE